MVNEMLTQMESFSGLMFASTNLVASLDQASLRRFDLKVEFKRLRPDQSWEIFLRACDISGIAYVDSDLEPKVRHLESLTLGDYAVVLRQRSFFTDKNAQGFYAALAIENAMKYPRGKRIGFV